MKCLKHGQKKADYICEKAENKTIKKIFVVAVQNLII